MKLDRQIQIDFANIQQFITNFEEQNNRRAIIIMSEYTLSIFASISNDYDLEAITYSETMTESGDCETKLFNRRICYDPMLKFGEIEII